MQFYISKVYRHFTPVFVFCVHVQVVYKHTYMCVCEYTRMSHAHTHTRSRAHTHIHTPRSLTHTYIIIYRCMYVGMHVCVYVDNVFRCPANWLALHYVLNCNVLSLYFVAGCVWFGGSEFVFLAVALQSSSAEGSRQVLLAASCSVHWGPHKRQGLGGMSSGV